MSKEIYRQRSRWKIFLVILGIIILLITTLYSNFLASKLKENEEKNIYIFTQALEDLLDATITEDYNELDKNITLQDSIVRAFPLPVIFEDELGVLDGQNWDDDKNSDTEFLKKMKESFLASGKTPIEGSGYISKIYYYNSSLLNYIKYYPIIQFLLVGLFILFGYFLFSTSRKAEQNRVWAGMAKETAHQLGTPISAIMAWIEHLRESDVDEYQQDIIHELNRDVRRLELVADRFSKIGSEPELKQINLYEEIQTCKEYMQKRAPKKVVFDFPTHTIPPIFVDINQHLFDWVIENLIRNSLDAMDGKGSISARIYLENNKAHIDITDTGKGIPASKHKTVFQPGYSTKTRGWGLGLSLAKRIIEEYHNGKIAVKSSKPGEGTTFTIVLPLSKALTQVS